MLIKKNGTVPSLAGVAAPAADAAAAANVIPGIEVKINITAAVVKTFILFIEVLSYLLGDLIYLLEHNIIFINNNSR